MNFIKILNTPLPARALFYGAGAFLLTSLFLYLVVEGLNYYAATKVRQVMPGVLVLNMGHQDLQLTALDKKKTKTFFDFDSEDFASQTAWIGENAAFLAIPGTQNFSRSQSKIIPLRLFGDSNTDGFYALSAFDSNSDNKIDRKDARWAELRLWSDDNKDAFSQEGELHTLEQSNIKSISLKTQEPEKERVSGNDIKKKSGFTYNDKTTGQVYSVSFANDKVNSYFAGNFILNVRALFLPALRGFGRLPDLHIAMSMDKKLMNLVEKEAQKSLASYFTDPQKTRNDIELLLFTWAKVSDLPQDSRGPNIDARKLEFLEKFVGKKFRQTGAGGTPDPLPQAAAMLLDSWRTLYQNLKVQIIIQVGGAALFDGPISYNPYTGTIEGTDALSEKGLADLVSFASASGVDAKAFWEEVADFLQYTKGLQNLTGQETKWLEEDVGKSNDNLSWAEIAKVVMARDPSRPTAQIVKLSPEQLAKKSAVSKREERQ